MRFKHLCQILLLVSVCVVSADQDVSFSETDNVGINTETQNVTDNVFHQAAGCTSDSDCHHLGKCETREGVKLCICKDGTSGDFCETVDECVNNPVVCGTLKDVSCVFDVVQEKAVCKCYNDSKTYVEDEERCMSPCTRYDQCGQYGYCYHEVGDLKFCACTLGTSGDYCEIIDECHNKDVDCGLEPNATCTLGGKGRAYCKCSDPQKGFDYDEKVCKDCAGCGENSYYSCIYRDGIRRCSCKTKFYSSDKGICEDCKCGPESRGCKFVNGTKICECWGGYQPNGDTCEKCDCGSEGSNCEFKDGEKVCTCKEGYIPAGKDSICTQMCNATNTCENGGKCVEKLCSCLKGTSGHLCKTIDDCRVRGKCGDADCLYNVTSQESYCKCSNTRLVFDDATKRCRVCDCGSYSRSCSYIEGKKKCKCMDAYEDRLGECTLCFCKGYSSMYGCRFDGYSMVCRCLQGFAQIGDECKECDCGDHGKCILSGWSKSCLCDDGYVQSGGKCLECNCGKYGNCYFKNGKKACSCYTGFVEYQGICKECDCGSNADCRFTYFGQKQCSCHSGHGMRDEVCTACNCDPGTSCEFSKNFLNKKCICPAGYFDDRGSCAACNCGMEKANCTQIDDIYPKCICPEGYEEKTKSLFDSTCIDIDECRNSYICPFSTNCVNTPGSFDCVCKEGYEPKYKGSDYNIKLYGCQDIDECVTDSSACNDIYAECVNIQGSYRCDCQEGYSVRKAYSEKYNTCQQASRPWRTATIVIGCLSAVIIVGLLIGICNKHMSLDNC